MALTKTRKKQMLDELKTILTGAKSAVFVDYSGTKVATIQDLRKKMRESEIVLRVTKNSLLKKALQENKIEVNSEILDKQLMVAFDAKDEVMPSKLLNEKAKEVETLKILGVLVNSKFYGEEMVKQLSIMPTREVILAQTVGTIKAPLTGFVNVLSGNLSGLINILSQYKDKKENNK